MMATEDGTQLLVSWLPENEKIIRFAKDEEGVLLWSIKREDGIDGTKVTFTARKMDSSICFQCDTTQPEFSELNPNDLYETLVKESLLRSFIAEERFIVSEDGMDMSL